MAKASKRDKPKQFGRYELLDKIGSGGMAEVFLARSFGAEGLEKQLVIKKILPAFAQKQRFVDMFKDEARIAVSLNHPNIVQTYDFGRVGDNYYIAMEYVEGQDLAKLLRRLREHKKRLPLGEALFLGVELCKGLDYAHRKKDEYGAPLKIVHRDISPHNLLISSEGNLKIVDFGIANARTITPPDEGLVKGKYNYMSPEQAIAGAIDNRSDIFSASVVLFEAIYGRSLYPTSSSEESRNLVRSAILPDFQAIDPEIPDEVERILYKGLERLPKRRYQSAREFQLDLHRLLQQQGDIHDGQTLAAFVSEVDALPPIAKDADEIITVDHGPEQTPSMQGSVLHQTSSQLSSSYISGLTPLPEQALRAKKDVVCVAGKLHGFEAIKARYPMEKWQSLLLEITRIFEAIAFKNRAIVEHFSEAGFLVLLGLPASSTNDAERGVFLALDLIEALAGINLNLEDKVEISMGIVLGRALVSHKPGQRHFEKELLGELTNLGHELAAVAAPMEILVGGRIYQRIRRSFELTFRHHHDFAEDERYGRSNPSIYEVSRPKTPQERKQDLQRSLVVLRGRELELKIIRDRLQRVFSEQKILGVAFSGETGTGKSALVEEFLKPVERLNRLNEDSNQVRILRAFATSQHKNAPFAAVREFVHDLIGVDLNAKAETILAGIRSHINHFFPQARPDHKSFLTQSLATHYDLFLPQGPLNALSGAALRRAIFSATTRFVEAVSQQQGLILVLEDGHLADSTSLEFIAQLMSSSAPRPIFIILTLQGGELSDNLALSKLVQAKNMRHERLGPLSSRHMAELVRDKLGDQEVDPAVIDHILERADGIPFFASELVDALRARDVLQLVHGRYVLGGSVGELWLPTNIEAAIAARIEELPSRLREHLRNASILGVEFDLRDAIFLFGEAFASSLDELVARKWLKERHGHHLSYRFTNTLSYEVALRELLWEERQSLHAKLAAQLIKESRSGERRIAPSLIAHHLEGAQDLPAAAEFYYQEAHSAHRQMSHNEALRLINSALRLSQTHSEGEGFAEGFTPAAIKKFLELKETILALLSLHQERYEILRRLLALTQEQEDRRGEASVLTKFLKYWYDRRDFDKAQDTLEEIQAIAHELELNVVQADADLYSALIQRETGNPEEAVQLLARAHFTFEVHDNLQSAAEALKLTGDTYWFMGRFEDARDAYLEALQTYPGGPRDLTEAINFNLGLVQASLGYYEDALNRYLEALRNCREERYLQREARILPNLGHLYLLLGQPKRATHVLRKAIPISTSLGDDIALADALATLGVVHLEQGRLVNARKELMQARALAIKSENTYLTIHTVLGLARLQLIGEHFDSCIEQARFCVDRGREAQIPLGIAHGSNLISLALAQQGEEEAALEHGNEALLVLQDSTISEAETILIEQVEMRLPLAHQEQFAISLLQRAFKTTRQRGKRISLENQRESFFQRARNQRILALAESLLIK